MMMGPSDRGLDDLKTAHPILVPHGMTESQAFESNRAKIRTFKLYSPRPSQWGLGFFVPSPHARLVKRETTSRGREFYESPDRIRYDGRGHDTGG